MYSLVLLAAMSSPEQCPAQRVAAVALAPVELVTHAARGGCNGRQARFQVHARGAGCGGNRSVGAGCNGNVQARTGCVGSYAAVAPPQPIAPPVPMVAAPPPVIVPPPVVKQTTTVTTTTQEAPCPATVAVAAPAKQKVDVFRRAPLRTHLANRATCPQ